MSRDALTELAEELSKRCIAALDGLPAETLYSLADALHFAAGPSAGVPVADLLPRLRSEEGERPGFLARLTMRGARKTVARQPAFLEQLADAQTGFWKAVHDAGIAIAEKTPAPVESPVPSLS